MKKKSIVLSIVLIFAGILLFGLAVGEMAKIRAIQKKLFVRLSSETDVQSAQNMTEQFLEKETGQIVFWSEEKRQYCENPDLGRTMDVKEIIYCGVLSVLSPECSSIYKPEADGECVIDEKTAEVLFGSTEGKGQTVRAGDKDYIISKVIEGKEGLFIRTAHEGEMMQYMTVQPGKADEKKNLLQKVMTNYGVGGEEMQLSLLYFLTACILSMIPAGCAAAGAAHVCRMVKERKRKETMGWIGSAAAGTVSAVVVFLICIRFFQSDPGIALYPLSDFEGWSQQMRLLTGQIRELLDMGKPWILGTFFETFRNCLAYTALAALCLAGGIKKRTYMKKEEE